MTTHSNDSKEQFERTIVFLTEDIESLNPSELRAAMDEIGLSTADAQAAQAYRREIGIRKFALAKKHLRDISSNKGQVVLLDGARAKVLLQAHWENNPTERPTTLAARKGEGLSDDTALKMYQSLVELGAISPDDGTEDV
jgi:hypothetical protein